MRASPSRRASPVLILSAYHDTVPDGRDHSTVEASVTCPLELSVFLLGVLGFLDCDEDKYWAIPGPRSHSGFVRKNDGNSACP